MEVYFLRIKPGKILYLSTKICFLIFMVENFTIQFYLKYIIRQVQRENCVVYLQSKTRKSRLSIQNVYSKNIHYYYYLFPDKSFWKRAQEHFPILYHVPRTHVCAGQVRHFRLE